MKYFLDGKYPMKANWLIKDKRDGMYYIKNVFTEAIIELDRESYYFLVNLNGKRNPYELARKVGVDADELMNYFTMNSLIRNGGRTLINAGGMILYTIHIPKKNKTKSIIPKVYNMVLSIGWIPMFVYGLYKILFTTYSIEGDYIHVILGFVLALFTGLVLHEISHIMACLAYGGSYLEAGVMCEKFFWGAYCLIDKSEITSKLKRAQINAAGVECNMFLAGLFSILCTTAECGSGCFLYPAILNGMLAICNLIPVSCDSDGYSIIEEMLGKS